eukprot:scaffold9303_cov80-Phaeocystis_antarctica.AAC.1
MKQPTWLHLQPGTLAADVCITEARDRGGVGNPRGLTMNVVPGPREGLVRPDPGSTPGRPGRPCEFRPPGLTHTLAYFTHAT